MLKLQLLLISSARVRVFLLGIISLKKKFIVILVLLVTQNIFASWQSAPIGMVSLLSVFEQFEEQPVSEAAQVAQIVEDKKDADDVDSIDLTAEQKALVCSTIQGFETEFGEGKNEHELAKIRARVKCHHDKCIVVLNKLNITSWQALDNAYVSGKINRKNYIMCREFMRYYGYLLGQM